MGPLLCAASHFLCCVIKPLLVIVLCVQVPRDFNELFHWKLNYMGIDHVATVIE